MREQLFELQQCCDKLQVDSTTFGQNAYQSDLNVLICVVQELIGIVDKLMPPDGIEANSAKPSATSQDRRLEGTTLGIG